ncbi:MAG: tetratricopeptide repeat protein [Burkholderiales bacterium]|nr:tetratricopeptide repeat protein [Burkholderiales bacterium]
MAFDLEEQEQIAVIKDWWKQYGNLVVLAVVVAALTVSALYGWRYYRHQQSLDAVTLYQQLGQAESVNDVKRVRDIAAQIADKYASTPYAAMAALAGARASFGAGDLVAAKTQLQWTIDKARDDEMRDVARLRLAGVLLDEKNYAEALKLAEAKPADSFSGLYADMKGDIYVALGKPAEARSAYQQALDKSDPQSQYRTIVQLKLDALGDAK